MVISIFLQLVQKSPVNNPILVDRVAVTGNIHKFKVLYKTDDSSTQWVYVYEGDSPKVSYMKYSETRVLLICNIILGHIHERAKRNLYYI